MSLAGLLIETVTVVTPGTTTDAYNNVVTDWSAGTRATYRGRIDQTRSTEVTVDRDTVTSDWLLFLLPTAVIDAHNRVEARGATFEVVGVPNVLYDRRGPHHIEARLVHIEGG